ncbi:MAG TPA: hypothetical protein VJ553_04785 [Candidatus Paceibacterota bacterium]|nr:hypothetical protein [Candidatus Paceibacterota bacterium]
MPGPSAEIVPGFLVVWFRETRSEDACRFVLYKLTSYSRTIHRSKDLLVWLVQVEKGWEKKEIALLKKVKGAGIHCVAPLTLHPPVPVLPRPRRSTKHRTHAFHKR